MARDLDPSRQHSLAFSLAMHLLPGVAIVLFYVLAVPVVRGHGFHAEFALLLSFAIVGIPLPLAYLYFVGKKQNASWSLSTVVLYRKKIPPRQYKLIVAFLVLFAIYLAVVSSLTGGIPSFLKDVALADLPRWFLNPYSLREVNPANSAILVTLVMRLAIDGIAHPIVEELYFRGYLMPRLSRYGAWCPVISALFFALFHLWQPQNMPVIFITVLPWMFLIWWQRNVYLSMLIHCLGNSITASIALVEFLT